MVEGLWLALLGLGTGTFGVTVGTGGGVILVPMLLLIFDMKPEVVAGTSLALVAINSFSGSAAYRYLGLIDLRSGLLFAAAAVPGSIIAPFAVKAVPGSAFRTLFALLMLGLASYMVFRPRPARQSSARSRPQAGALVTSRRITAGSGHVFEYQFNEALATGFNVALGFISSFFGVGGGFLRTPLLVAAFGFPIRVAVATSVFSLSISATTGSTVHAFLGHVEWYPTLVWVGAGLLVGSQIGSRLAATINARWITRLLIGLLFAMGVRLMIQGALGV